MSEHLDLDALADLLADDSGPGAAHLTNCTDCTVSLAELRTATTGVAAALAELLQPQLPADIQARLNAALATAPAQAQVTTLPAARPAPARRWLPAAAAVVLLLAGAGYGLSRLGDDKGSTAANSEAGAAATTAGIDVVRNSTGTDYTDRSSLAAAVPQLLAGSAAADSAGPKRAAPFNGTAPQNAAPPNAAASGAGAGAAAGTAPGTGGAAAGPDPLARLRDNAGLADCLLALLPPDDPSVRPLALDYGSFKGTPAMVVVLPGAAPSKLDVYVVGAGCSQANDSTLFYTSVDKP